MPFPAKSDRPDPPRELGGPKARSAPSDRPGSDKIEYPLSINDRIAFEFDDADGTSPEHKYSGHNFYSVARRLWNSGVHNEDQIIEVLKSVRANHSRIKSVWAYINSAGLLNTALSRSLENESARYKKEAANDNGMELIGDIMRRTGGPDGTG